MENSFIIPDISTVYEHIMQRGLRSPPQILGHLSNLAPPPHLRVPPLLSYYILSAPRLCMCFFVFMFLKNQLSQSEDKIYCHNSSVTLLASPIHFILLTH